MKSLATIILIFILSHPSTDAFGYEIMSEEIEELYSTAQKLQKEGRYNEALDHFGRVLNYTKDIGDDASYASIARKMGSIYSTMNLHEDSIKYRSRAIEIYKTQGNEKQLGILLLLVGDNYNVLDQPDKAMGYYERALAINKRTGNEPWIASNLSAIGTLQNSMGHHKNALINLEEALKINKRLGDESNVEFNLSVLGIIYEGKREFDQSIKYFNKALEISKRREDHYHTAEYLGDIARGYGQTYKHDKAIEYYKSSLKIYKELKDEENIADTLNSIAGFYTLAQANGAGKLYDQALTISRKLGQKDMIASNLSGLAIESLKDGNLEKAEELLSEALNLYVDLGQKSSISLTNSNIALIHAIWGQYDKALEKLNIALKIDRNLKDKLALARDLARMGQFHHQKREDDKALKIFIEVLEINKEIGNTSAIISNFNFMGTIYTDQDNLEKARDNFEEALKLSSKHKISYFMDVSFIGLGLVHLKLKNYDKAKDYFKTALESSMKFGNELGVWMNQILMSEVHYIKNELPLAIKYSSDAVKSIDNLLNTSTGNKRKGLLSNLIYPYKTLISSYFKNGQLSKSFDILEQSRSRLLIEKLFKGNTPKIFPSVLEIQEGMENDSVILSYSLSDKINREGGELFQLLVSKDKINGNIFSSDDLQELLKQHENSVKKWFASQVKTGGLMAIQGTKGLFGEKEGALKDLVRYYKYLLTQNSNENKNTIKEVSKTLYQILIKPFLTSIKDSQNLIIIPDSVLGFLPFETLIDDKGRYLVENFDISYIQSVGVLQFIKDRNHPKRIKSLLAFGGAVYDPTLLNVNVVAYEPEISHLSDVFFSNSTSNNTRSAGEALARLGYNDWPNLPGTKLEVEGIKGIIKDATILTGNNVTEARIKEMSHNGELAQFKVLHFATHGLTVSELPELSSIILSQFKDHEGPEDGYLRMPEIANLNIKADFVNLSACETGLGKLYAGEGVVGLTHAFLLAGANGLSVSLWNVADNSTAVFMTGMYQLVEQKGLSYSQAINEMKRQFIKGKVLLEPDAFDGGMQILKDIETDSIDISHPFYWAPFVYYGKN